MNENLRDVKRRFFALRNGVVADRLRKAGNPYKIIFGLLLPQLEQIASETVHSSNLAEELWNNCSTRESRLLATMIYPVDEMSLDKAFLWIESADTVELIDTMCFKLLRYLPDALQLATKYFSADNHLLRYFSLRLLMNLIVLNKIDDTDSVYEFAKLEMSRNDSLTRGISSQIIDELDFRHENSAEKD